MRVPLRGGRLWRVRRGFTLGETVMPKGAALSAVVKH